MTERKKDKRTRRVWRYQRGNQNSYIEEEQTTQWPKEKRTKGQEEFEDTKGAIRIRISKKNRQHNDRKKTDKRTRRVWRYQRGNQNSYIEKEQTTQWPKEKGQKDKKSLKIPKGQSESVYRRTDNTMTERKKDKRTRTVWRYQRDNQYPYIKEEQTTDNKRKSTKGQATIYKAYI